MKIYRNSINLFDIAEFIDGIVMTRGTYAYNADTDTLTITATGNASHTGNTNAYHIPVSGSTTYTISTISNNVSGRMLAFENGITSDEYSHSTTTDTLTFTTLANTEYLILRLGCESEGTSKTYSDLMINEGSVALPYEPYNVVDWYGLNPHIYRKGYNLFNGTSYNAGISSTPPCYYPAATGGNRTSIFIVVEPLTTYTVSLGEVVDRITIVGYFNTFDPEDYTIENQKAADEIITSLVTNVQQATFTTGNQTVFVGILCGLNTLATDIMVNKGSIALPYEEYDTTLKWYAAADHKRTSGAWS